MERTNRSGKGLRAEPRLEEGACRIPENFYLRKLLDDVFQHNENVNGDFL